MHSMRHAPSSFFLLFRPVIVFMAVVFSNFYLLPLLFSLLYVILCFFLYILFVSLPLCLLFLYTLFNLLFLLSGWNVLHLSVCVFIVTLHLCLLSNKQSLADRKPNYFLYSSSCSSYSCFFSFC
ncbi:hypothetical protein BZA70DRAFT_145511 [Myxozyma melibiosi]|uniref:Uncharacterized protein n=1 Tax=Myxozyma melibiosi TaxID=54550 RepID=A0ABR1F7Q7_9ASCO